MGRVFSTRRVTLTFAFVSALLIVLMVALLQHRCCGRQRPVAHESLEAIQRLMASAYREMPEGRFSLWLGNADLRAWAPAGWNIWWLSRGPSIRWSLHPADSEGLPPEILETVRTFERDPTTASQCLCFQKGQTACAMHISRLSPDNPEAGLVLLRAPLPRISFGAPMLGLAAILFAALLIGLFALHQRLLLRTLQSALQAAGIPPLPWPPSDESIEPWVRQYVAIASRKILEKGDLFDNVFDLLQDGTILLDAENRILRANTTGASLLGEQPETLVGRCISDIPDHAVLEPFVGEIRSSCTYQTSEIHLSATATLCNAAGIPLDDNCRTPCTHIMLILRDLTRIRQLELAGEEYAVNVSHELKTPLTLILGYTETLLSHADMAPEFRERSLRTIERHAKRIIRIIDDLLRLAWLRNEADTVGIPRAPVLLSTVIDDVVSICREWARSAGLAIETHVPEGLVWSLNSGLMEEALVNLVKNAILYAIVGPVELRARVLESGNLELAVIDRGPGLKPEDANRIFDRFYRVDKSRSRASGGSGLGLPIVQQIVDGHHGTARIETAPGEGCTFLLEIPPGA